MIEPTSSTPGADHVTIREFEAWQKAQLNEACLRQEKVDEARIALEKLMDHRFEALTTRMEEMVTKAIDRTNARGDARSVDVTTRFESLNKDIDRRFSGLDQLLNERQTSSAKALELTRDETQKHLAALNGEQARLAADRERFLSRETHDVEQKDFQLWKEVVNRYMATGAGKGQGAALVWGAVIAAFGIVVGLIGLVSRFL